VLSPVAPTPWIQEHCRQIEKLDPYVTDIEWSRGMTSRLLDDFLQPADGWIRKVEEAELGKERSRLVVQGTRSIVLLGHRREG